MAPSFDIPPAVQPTRLSPFDQVLEREREEDARIHDALALLNQERTAEEDALRAEHEATIERARLKGREELVHYKNTHLPVILQQGEEEAVQEVARIERQGALQIDRAAKNVLDVAYSPDFPSLL